MTGGYPFKDGDTVVVLGEIDQMPGHAVIALNDGRVLFGWDIEYFRKLTDEEA
jgi:SOS-response transcriptional repressor LexA